MLIESEIYGIGFPLACDFLKEVGYVKFGKPDIHIKDIFFSLNLSDRCDDYSILEAISRIANNVYSTSYAVDRLFWIIGSGKFFNHNMNIGRQKDAFIDYVRQEFRQEPDLKDYMPIPPSV